MAEPVRSIDVPDGERPDPEVIAARIDLGCACYHDLCCPFALYAANAELFTEVQACTCGGEEMARAYAELTTEQSGEGHA